MSPKRVTKVINLYGGPGSGKSTIAAGVFYELKKRGIKCELVREYVKKWAWEGILPNRLDQLYITGKQSKAEHMLYEKVDVIVTDCPLMLGVFYDLKYNYLDTVADAVRRFLHQTREQATRVNYIVDRTKKYDADGRFCSEETAIQTDAEIVDFLQNNSFPFTQLNGSMDDQRDAIVNEYLQNELINIKIEVED